jgi:anti-sigma B factor antagonist
VSTDGTVVTFETHGPVTLGTIDNASMLDGLTVNDFGKEVVDHVNAHPGSHLLLNFAHVQYLSSAALTELIRIDDACVSGNGSLRVCNVSKDIRKVFQITNFDKLFDIHEEETSEAIRRFGRSVELSREEEEWAKKNKNF